MADKKQEIEIKDYAGGWITERKGTEVPGFLKLSYFVIAAGCIVYLILYMNGEVGHSDRGALVQALNQVTGGAGGFMWLVVALAVVYTVITLITALRKDHKE